MQIKKDYTRKQIVEIAKRVFLKNGYAKARMLFDLLTQTDKNLGYPWIFGEIVVSLAG